MGMDHVSFYRPDNAQSTVLESVDSSLSVQAKIGRKMLKVNLHWKHVNLFQYVPDDQVPSSEAAPARTCPRFCPRCGLALQRWG